MSSSVIEIKNVTKMYGKDRGVLDISLDVPKGSVYGFLGPNGAGKTTTISMLVDLIHPTKGKINIFGLDAKDESLKIRKRMGFLGGDMMLDGGLTGWQQLEHFGRLRGNFDKKYIKLLAEKFDCDLNRKIKTLSRGNRQKVGLISSLMHKPELLIYDEPTSGLDPLIQDEFNEIINDYRKAGKTVFVSSHILSEVEILCDHVAFIKEGKLISEKPISQISAGLAKSVHIVAHKAELSKQLNKLNGVSHLKTKDSKITFQYSGDVQQLISLLSKQKIKDITITPPDLDTIFTKLYGGKDAK
jgi:ABC-2 type transport system ATP-binding protein